MQHAFIVVRAPWKFLWSLEIQGEEMRRVIAYVVILGFFNAASVATARSGDGGTPSREIDNQPAAKSDDSTKTDARENEKDAVESELQELRDLIQSQTEELHELRTRLAAVEVAGTTTKEPPASPAGT